jgi:hypothetical protein
MEKEQMQPCPYCGAAFRYHRRGLEYDYWECKTARTPEGHFFQGTVCMKKQLEQLKKENAELKKANDERIMWNVAQNPKFWKLLKKKRKEIKKNNRK